MGLMTHDYSTYTQNLNITEGYVEGMVSGLVKLGVHEEAEAYAVVRKAVKACSPDKTKITLVTKDHEGVRGKKTLSLTDFLDSVDKSDLFIAPTLATFHPPHVKRSLVVDEIKDTLARRSVVKKIMVKAEGAGDKNVATMSKGLQNAIKVLVNSWSGASLSPFNPFYCKSIHPALTTMCRISTAIATSIVERLMSGTRYYHTPHKVVEDILSTIKHCNRTAIQKVLDMNWIHVPTVEETLEVILNSTRLYWWDDSKRKTYTLLVNSLTDIERMAFVYGVDFYNLYKFNHDYIYGIIANATEIDPLKLPHQTTNVLKTLNGDEMNLLSGLVGATIKGTSIWENINEGDKHLDYINNVAVSMMNALDKLVPIADAFFKVKHLPLDVGNQDNSIRRTVPAGDTDSTIFSVLHIVDLHYGDVKFGVERNPVVEFCIFLVNGAIEHGLGTFTGQMNVQPDVRASLVMKSEFNFPVMMLTNVAKTYHGIKTSVEGMVYTKPEFELKGARFHAGKGNIALVTKLKDWMNNNLINLTKGIKINRGELVDMIYEVEQDIAASISRKENVYFQKLNKKALAEYSNPKSQDYAKQVMYNETFGATYDKMSDNEQVGCYKIPLKFNNGVEAWYATLTRVQQKGYDRYLAYVGKPLKDVPTFTIVPVEVVHTVGLPNELKDIVNLTKLTKSTLDPHYLNLGSMGITMNYKESNRLISDFIDGDSI